MKQKWGIGLVMFVVPILLGWLGPYVLYSIPGYEPNRLVVSLMGDLIFLSSLLVLGGDFWDKVRALFIHESRALLPKRGSATH